MWIRNKLINNSYLVKVKIFQVASEIQLRDLPRKFSFKRWRDLASAIQYKIYLLTQRASE